ncbi:MAG: hypothetical protein HC853_15975 [Anaerolineae bacterium]|nr:hypothetical protein [Anaerolineae bacterium]
MNFWKRRSIQMPAPVDPEKFEVTYGMGVRETVLVCIAAVQAIWLIFLNESMPFVLRLCIALFVAAVLLGVALIPYKDKPIEYTIAKWIGYRFNHQGRIYRTASRDESETNLQQQIEAPETEPVPASSPPKAKTRKAA